jgi:hypothetical protein
MTALMLKRDRLILKRDHIGESLYAGRTYRSGEVVLAFEQVEWRSQRDRDTVEHPFGGHLFHPLLAKTAHGCTPNCRLSFADRTLIAIRNIASGDPVSFDYHSTERRLNRPFDCLCGSDRCRGRIE